MQVVVVVFVANGGRQQEEAELVGRARHAEV